MPISQIGTNSIASSTTFTTPNLGTPTAINLSNATGLTVGSVPTGTVVQVAVGYSNFNGTLTQGNSYNVGNAITPVTSYSKLIMIGNVYLRSPYAYGTYGDYTIGSSGIGNGLSDSTATYFNFATGMNSGNLGGSTYTAATATNSVIHYAVKGTGSWTTSDTPWFGMSIGPVYGGTYWGAFTVVYYFIKQAIMENAIKFIEAVISLRPNSIGKFSTCGQEITEWVDNENSQPTNEEVLAEVSRLDTQKELNAQAQVAAKQAALNKLMALGLTEEEALALGK